MPDLESLKGHLRRQHTWYEEWWRWLLQQKVLPWLPPRPTALDVGCGPGLVMGDLSDLVPSQGLDRDRGMVGECLAKGIEAVVGDAQRLPFRDGSYDLVYCSFLLLWARDPEAVVREMARVSRGWVVCLAEPDYLARVDHPEALSELTVLIAQGAREAGADPAMGRRLRSLFCRNGMRAEVGVIPGIWPLEREAAEMEAEWSWSRSMLPASTPGPTVQRLRRSWEGALRDGTLLRFNPAFYAIARRPQTEERASRQR